MVWYHEPQQWKIRAYRVEDARNAALKMRAYDHFYHTLYMLNESMGMCIR